MPLQVSGSVMRDVFGYKVFLDEIKDSIAALSDAKQETQAKLSDIQTSVSSVQVQLSTPVDSTLVSSQPELQKGLH